MEQLERRHKRIRKKVFGTPERPRLSVYRSLKYIYAQLVDDVGHRTFVSVTSQPKTDEPLAHMKMEKGNKVDKSKECGKLLARLALEKGIKEIVFDRGGYNYHGRVKAIAEGAREGGLNF
ncbi:MAG: 50S ribosomal protein L18 [Candidatus Stahlbacteria bacterium]|nr:50S ribosomal protein L18 [Candidatus Stahlbacteria bacterium]